jgi:polyisoprenoid-binding protein YceI
MLSKCLGKITLGFMRSSLFLIAVAMLTLGAIFAQESPPNSWTIATADSMAHFSVAHNVVMKATGTFTGIRGTAIYDPKNPAKASVEATIDVTTVNTGVAKRDEQIRNGPDFFDSKKYPVMSFKSTKVTVAGKYRLRVSGDLTMNGITHPVTFAVDGPTPEITDSQGRVKIGLTATTNINRQDYNITYKELMGAGDLAVGNQVSIELNVEMVKNQSATDSRAAKK